MSMLSIIAASRRRLDADALAYLAAVEAADAQALEPEVRTAINRFVVGCKSDGIWDAIKASCILAGARTLAGCLVPLKGAAPTNVGGNFVSGDYDRKTGLVGNGSTKYLNSNRNNNADPQNDNHNAIYQTQQAGSGTTQGMMGSGSVGSGANNITISLTNKNIIFRSRNNTSFIFNTNINSIGLLGHSRASSGSCVYRVQGSNTTVSQALQTPENGNILVFTQGANFTTSRLAFYSIGESLDLALLDDHLTALMAAINAALP